MFRELPTAQKVTTPGVVRYRPESSGLACRRHRIWTVHPSLTAANPYSASLIVFQLIASPCAARLNLVLRGPSAPAKRTIYTIAISMSVAPLPPSFSRIMACLLPT